MPDPRGARRRKLTLLESSIESLLGPELVWRLLGLIRAVRIFDASNRTLQVQVDEILQLLGKFSGEEIVLVAAGQVFHVNGIRVRATGLQSAAFDTLSSEMEARGIVGFRFQPELRGEEITGLARLFLDHKDPAQAKALLEAVAAAGITHALPIALEDTGSTDGTQVPEEPGTEREQAQDLFRQAVAGTRGAILATARTGKPAIRRIKRVVQPIVDSILHDEHSLVGLTAIKDHDEYTYAHCVNVGILSVAMGHYLGMSRAALGNLGVAALLHDIGKLRIPPAVLGKAGPLTPEEWTQMRRHPLEGVKMVTHVPELSALTVDLINVTLEHHRTCDGKGYPAIAHAVTPSVAARIVATADCYDALTAHRAYRKRPFTGYEALRMMLGADRARYDSAALWALVKTVGCFPAGSTLLTDSGHLVVSLSPNPEDAQRPNCVVLARPDGSMPDDSAPETWNPMPSHISVARVLDPDEYEEQVGRLLAA